MSFNPYQEQIERLQSEIEASRSLITTSSDPELKQLATEEVQKLSEQLADLEQMAQDYQSTLQSAETETASDEHINCIIELRAGVGGDEASIWAHDILRAYIRFAEILGLKFEYIDDLIIKVIGRTSKMPELETENKHTTAYQVFMYESGVHRVQRIPETEAQGRIHTSTCSVAVLPEVTKSSVEIKDEDLEWQFMRSSGAGGQSVNKTNSAVRLTHRPSGIVVSARQERKQTQNREIALSMLRSQLWEIEEAKKQAQIGQARSVIGRANRSEKIRTYNFPQSRITDHRTKQSWHNLTDVLDGNMGEMITDLHQFFRQEDEDSQIQTSSETEHSPKSE